VSAVAKRAARPSWPARAALVAVDVQEAFARPTDWHVPGLSAITGRLAEMASLAGPERTLLTLFRPARRLVGSWRPYYRTYAAMRDPKSPLWDIVPALQGKGHVVEKSTYSAFASPAFVSLVHRLRPRVLAVCGVETDVCVLSTVQDAIDRGLPVCVLEDLCLSSDPAGHAAAVTIWRRLPDQVKVMSAEDFLAKGERSWRS
jgi:nicotinamidase-related amidase